MAFRKLPASACSGDGVDGIGIPTSLLPRYYLGNTHPATPKFGTPFLAKNSSAQKSVKTNHFLKCQMIIDTAQGCGSHMSSRLMFKRHHTMPSVMSQKTFSKHGQKGPKSDPQNVPQFFNKAVPCVKTTGLQRCKNINAPIGS